MVLSVRGRGPVAVLIEPIARVLCRMGISPNAVTFVGTLVSIVFALWLIPTGHAFAAAVLIGLTVATDMIDGTMARMRGGGTRFGATLDATCDRLTDGAVFGAMAFWFATDTNPQPVLLALCLIILVASQVTSYVKARAEASGIKVVGGLIERPERLIISLVSLGLFGLGVSYILPIGLWLLCVGSLYTVVERLMIAARSAAAEESIAAPDGAREFSAVKDAPACHE